MAEKTNPVPVGAAVPKSRFFTPYVLIWAALASGSLLYLALLATQPALVASFLGAGPQTQTADTSEEKRAMAEAVSEVRLLRETVDRFRDDLQELKAEVANQSERGGDLTARLSTLEAAATAAAAAAAEPQKTAATDKRGAAAKQAKTAEAAKAAPPAAKKIDGALETGSVAGSQAAVSFGPAVVTPATKTAAKAETTPPKQLGVQIASGPSVDSLRLSWSLLAERHGSSLRSLQPRYTVGSDGTNSTYDLVVGPLSSAAEATRLCQELSAMATPCSISVYTGDVL